MLGKHFNMKTEEKYIEGFNTGYLIARHEARLADILLNNLANADDFFQGFIDGKDQQLIEVKLSELQQLTSFRLKEHRDREI